MPAREIRDTDIQPVSGTPLVTPELGLQRTAVELVLADFEAAKTARGQRDYGKTAKGETLDFDKWLKELKDLYFARRIPKTLPWKFCYSKDTEILTKDGWKLVAELTTNDQVYSMNPETRLATWMPVTQTVQNYYDEMIHFKGKSVDLIVSKDHQMLIERADGRLMFKSAQDISQSMGENYIPLVSEFDCSTHPKKIYGFDASDWMKFLGWFVSEGFVNESGTVLICQDDLVNSEKCEEIRNLLTRMGLRFSYSSNKQFIVWKHGFSEECREELRGLGKADEKHIPSSYLNLSPALLTDLFDAMMLGDGTNCTRDGKTPLVSYYTSSEQLADQVQEICQKIGKRATIAIMHEAGTEFEFSNGRYAIKQDVLCVRILNKQRVQCNKLFSSVIPYNDYAYCLETPYHTVLVRRNGRAVWCGNCSNRSLMIAMAILEVLHARLFPAVYNEDLTRWRPTEFTDEERAQRVEKFMFWWIRVHAKLREFFDRWCRTIIGFGDALTVTSWDVQLRDKGQQSPAQSQVNPDGTVTVTPPEKMLDRFEVSRSDLIQKEDVFLQAGATDIQRDTLIIRRKYLYRDLEEMERDGKVSNITQPSLQGQQSLKELLPVISAAGQGITPEQQAELEDIRRRNQQVECLEWWGGIDLDGDTHPEQMRLLISPTYKLFLGAVHLSDLSKKGVRPLDLTMFLPRLDEPHGLVGLGVLEQVKELALEIDAIFNQLTDSNSLSIMRPIFYNPSGDLDPASMQIAPNKMIPVSNPQQNIFVPDFNIDTNRLLLAIRTVMDFVERLTSAGTVVFGQESTQAQGSGTATRTEAIVGASNQRHSIPVQRLREGAARIMSQHLDLIQKRADEPDGFLAMMERRVLGERGEPLFAQNELATDGLAGEYDAYLLPDESLGSKEAERNLAQLLYTIALGNPIIMSDASKLYKVTADLYKAFGKDPEQYLGIAPDVKQTDRPEDENTLILEGSLASVQASVLDNHIEHILSHEQLPSSPVFQLLAPEIQQKLLLFLQAHVQQHMQLMQLMVQLASRAKVGGGFNAAQSNGTPRRGAGPAQAIGPEPGMGSVQSPRAQAGGVQRAGESQGPAGV